MVHLDAARLGFGAAAQFAGAAAVAAGDEHVALEL